MASPDVIRDMGDTLLFLLRSSIDAAMVPPDRITLATPDEFSDLQGSTQPALTVFLYRIAINPEMRNSPRRTLPSGGTSRPLLPLHLHYLITPWAQRTRDEHRIAGRVLQTLYDHSELGSGDLQGDAWAAGDSAQLLLESLSIDDHYRIWDSSNLPYRLSLTYMARVIGIEPGAVLTAAPVLHAEFGGGGE